MKKYFIVFAIVALLLGAYYTHTKTYVEAAYDKVTVEGCATVKDTDHAFCLIGMSMIGESVTSCMQKSLFSTSESTITQCSDKALKEFDSGN